MKLSRKSDYALRAVRCCTKLPKGHYGSIRFISESESIPREFLAKILKELTTRKILISFRGVTGGYILARDPKEISFLDVIEAMNGTVHINLCTESGAHRGEGRAKCEMCDFWKSQEKAIKKALAAQHFGKYKKTGK
jgi:Rrf2 family protein